MRQILESLLAIPAFIPVAVIPGYVAAWFTNLHRFRQQSLVERIFWSIPLSMGISPICAVLIGKAFSLATVVAAFVSLSALCAAVMIREQIALQASGKRLHIGWSPLGNKAFFAAILWIVFVVLSLVDIQRDHQLYMNLTIFDHAQRANWTDSVLRTGVPPKNSLYLYKHPAAMRNYYFWYVLCATITKLAHLPVRAVLIAGCIWAGFALAALSGLFLKHFLAVGEPLRPQFLGSVGLLTVGGLDVCVNVWRFLHGLPVYIEVWPAGFVASWSANLLYGPHHVESLVCCMFTFLLAWLAADENRKGRIAAVVLIAASLSSAFGLSIYVAFAFLLVIFIWAIWQVVVERRIRSVSMLAAGGVGSTLLLVPYLLELTHGSSGLQGTRLFGLSVREMIPPENLMAWDPLSHLAAMHSVAARNLANLALLIPGYAVELGFLLPVFLLYLVPAWRGHIRLAAAHRSLLVIAAGALPVMSFLRSGVLATNDFGWKSPFFFQLPLLLLASPVVTSWNRGEQKRSMSVPTANLSPETPRSLRSVAGFALVLGVMTTISQALILRFNIPLVQANMRAARNPEAGRIPHNAYISAVGYAKLDSAITRNAVVQFNLDRADPYWLSPDFLGVNHQIAIASDHPWCGAELGGDPSGCLRMLAAIDALYQEGSGDQARATCRQIGIQYLVARVYDPPWKDKSGWVWTLPPVVADPEFRALDCR